MFGQKKSFFLPHAKAEVRKSRKKSSKKKKKFFEEVSTKQKIIK